MKNICQVIMLFVIVLFFCGCSANNQSYEESFRKPKHQPTTIGEIAFDSGTLQRCRIYLEEDNNLVPFIVLTSDYNGNCLLMREYLLDDLITYNERGEYASYYNGSRVDRFLNDDYYFRLSEKLQQLVVASEIEITPKIAIDTHSRETETIIRRVFLLSAEEVNSSIHYVALKEGQTLSYFKKIDNRKATFSNLEKGPWILRTPALVDSNTIFGVGGDGSVGTGGIFPIDGKDDSPIRPVFCIPSDTPIMISDIEPNTFCIK